MKKSAILVLIDLFALASCDSADKVNKNNSIAEKYFTIEEGVYKSG